MLSDGLEIAIKRFEDPQTQARVLPVWLQHENVVRCVGYCHEASQDMVVEEYMPNGTLSEIINGLISLNCCRCSHYIIYLASPPKIYSNVQNQTSTFCLYDRSEERRVGKEC